MDKKNLVDNEMFKLGMGAGRRMLMNHIQRQFERGKPVEINGELYWLKDKNEHLQEIMDDMEKAWREEAAGDFYDGND